MKDSQKMGWLFIGIWCIALGITGDAKMIPYALLIGAVLMLFTARGK